MRVLKFITAAALIVCFVRLASCGVEWVNDTPAAPDELSEIEIIHYRDASGDYLFMRNLYETNRMAYAICGGEDSVRIRLTVPEDILSDAFSPWDPERVRVLAAGAGHGDTVCVEAWDMFKNGVYYKTVYEIGVDRGEAGHE